MGLAIPAGVEEAGTEEAERHKARVERGLKSCSRLGRNGQHKAGLEPHPPPLIDCLLPMVLVMAHVLIPCQSSPWGRHECQLWGSCRWSL